MQELENTAYTLMCTDKDGGGIEKKQTAFVGEFHRYVNMIVVLTSSSSGLS